MAKNDINMIVAVSKNGAIGRNGGLAFHSKTDMRYFKEKTVGNVVIMGRGTFESLGCKPLPNRVNIVVSTKKQESRKDVTFCDSIESAIGLAMKVHPYNEKWIIGGEKVYTYCLEHGYADKVYLTEADIVVEDASAWFPVERLKKEWPFKVVKETFDEESGMNLKFMVFTNNKHDGA